MVFHWSCDRIVSEQSAVAGMDDVGQGRGREFGAAGCR